MNTITETTKLAIRPGLSSRDVGQKVFILSRESRMHILDNRSASFLWELLEKAGTRGTDAAELAIALGHRFDVAADVARRDSLAFVRELSDLRVLEAL